MEFTIVMSIGNSMNPKQLETLKKNNEETRDFVRSCLSFAFMIALKETGPDKITVSQLCTLAGVSRTAFYRNYNSVDEVLEDKIRSFANSLGSSMSTDIYNNWLTVFKKVEENKLYFQTIIESGYGHKIHEIFLSLLPKSEENRTIQFIWVSLFYSMMIKWLKDKKPKSAEDMARLAYKYTKNVPLVSIERY